MPKSRFTPEQLFSLGYPAKADYSYRPSSRLDFIKDDMPLIVAGGFDNIMEIIFANDDGSIPNLLKVSVNENTPDSVRQFVNNVLSANITAFKSAPDDETAFDMICPRGSSLEEYADFIKDSIHRYKREFDEKNKSDSSKSD